MSRPLKFRAWDKINLVWLNLFKLNIEGDGTVTSVSDLQGEMYGLHQVELMQWTGLLDKKGKEVYQGDVLYFNSPEGETFYEGKAAVGTHTCGYSLQPIPKLTDEEESVKGYDSSMFWHDFSKEVEIIGNIYENPELVDN